MFKLAQTPSYTAPVEVTLPGETAKQTFDVEFKRLTKTDIIALNERIRSGAATDRDICHDIVLGWAGVKGADGDMPFSVANLDSLLDIHPVEQCVIAAFFASLAGARIKN